MPLASDATGVALALGLGAVLGDDAGDAVAADDGDAETVEGNAAVGSAVAADGVGVGEPHAVVNRRMARSTAPIRRG